MQEIDWDLLQKVYDEDKVSTRELAKMFKIPVYKIYKATKDGIFKSRDKDELNLIRSIKSSNRKHSDDTKKKISNIRREYLKNNPDKVPYLLNHSRNESYPEKYFNEILSIRVDNLEKFHQVGIYEIDLAIINKKIAIEIDGEQHYYDSKIFQSDIRKNKYLEDLGWDIIRIRWRDYKKLKFEDKKMYIDELVSYINNLIEDKPIFNIEDSNKYCHCGNIITKRAKECNECHRMGRRLIERPNKIDLENDISELGYRGTGRKYGVSDNSIRKWLKSFNEY